MRNSITSIRSIRTTTIHTCPHNSSPLPTPSLTHSHSSTNSDTIHIIDGTALLYKAYFGLGKQKRYSNLMTNPTTDPITGVEIPSVPFGAVAALTTMFTRYCRKVQPTHVAVVFDAGKKTFRNRLYAPYKQQRDQVIALYYTALHYTIPHYTTLHCTILYYTLPIHGTTLHYTALHYTILYYTTLYYTVLYCTILYYTVLYCTTLYYTKLHCTILYHTVLYCTILH
jgi:hypothetical protein